MTGLKVVNAGIRRFLAGLPMLERAHDAMARAQGSPKLAARQRRDADAQFDHLRRMIERLELKDDPVDFVMFGSEAAEAGGSGPAAGRRYWRHRRRGGRLRGNRTERHSDIVEPALGQLRRQL